MAITPEQLAKAGTEHAHQCALFCWAAKIHNGGGLGWPEVLPLMFAIPNGGQRGDGTARGAAIAGGKLKAEGVKEGVPDIMLPVPKFLRVNRIGAYDYYHGLFIEMKRPKSVGKARGRVQVEQSQFAKDLEEMGYKCVVAYGWEQARDAILEYLTRT